MHRTSSNAENFVLFLGDPLVATAGALGPAFIELPVRDILGVDSVDELGVLEDFVDVSRNKFDRNDVGLLGGLTVDDFPVSIFGGV